MTIRKELEPEREFDSGAKRQAAAGKGTPVLFPGDAYLDICKHFEDGAVHYGGRNWEKGLPLSSYIDSLERHIAQEKMGLTDESHDRAIAWNAICYLATKLRIQVGILPKELDDLEGAYRIKADEVADDCLIKKASGFYYIYSLANGYLWRDLKFHAYIGFGKIEDTEGYYLSRKTAKVFLNGYLMKNKHSRYCEECGVKILNSKAIPVCDECKDGYYDHA